MRLEPVFGEPCVDGAAEREEDKIFPETRVDAEIVQFRRQREREEKEREAAAKRRKHGLTKEERIKEAEERARSERELEAHRLEEGDKEAE